MSLLSLVAELGINTTPFTAGLDKAKFEARKFGNEVGSHIKGQLAGMFAVTAIEEFTRRTIEWGGNIRDLADKTELSTDSVQELGFAAEQTGANFETIADAMKKLAVAREDALSGDDKKMDAFSRLGVSLGDLKSKTPQQLFEQIAERIHQAGDSTEYMTAVLETMGRSADSLLPAMKNGITDVINEFRTLNATVNEETINALDNVGDKLDELKVKFRKTVVQNPVSGGIIDYLTNSLKHGFFGGGAAAMGFEKGNLPTPEQLIGGILNEAFSGKGLKSKSTTFSGRGSYTAEQEKKDLEARNKLDEQAAKIRFQLLSVDERRKILNERLVNYQQDFWEASKGSRQEAEARLGALTTFKDLQDLDKPEKLERISPLKADSLAAVGTYIGGAATLNTQLDLARASLRYTRQIAENTDPSKTLKGIF